MLLKLDVQTLSIVTSLCTTLVCQFLRGTLGLMGMHANAAVVSAWQRVREGELQYDGEVVRHRCCGYLAMLTVSNVKLGAEGVRAGRWVGALLPLPLLSISLVCALKIHFCSINQCLVPHTLLGLPDR